MRHMVYRTDNYYCSTATPAPLEDIGAYISLMITKPVVTDEKETVPMWGFYRASRKGPVRKTAENFDAYTLVVLDVDGGMPISEAQDRFRSIWHYGYTSFRHRKDNLDRYRLMFPQPAPLPFDIYGTTIGRNILFRHFPCADKSTFHRARFFVMPAYHPNRKHLYRCWHCQGDYLDLSGLEGEIREEMRHAPLLPVEITPEAISSATGSYAKMLKKEQMHAIEQTKQELSAVNFKVRGKGVVHDTLLRKNAHLKHAGLGESERLRFLLSYARGPELEREIRTIVTGRSRS